MSDQPDYLATYGGTESDRCRACGVSKQQALALHDDQADLIRRAAVFVNGVAAIADDKTAALAWLADAAKWADETGPAAVSEGQA